MYVCMCVRYPWDVESASAQIHGLIGCGAVLVGWFGCRGMDQRYEVSA